MEPRKPNLVKNFGCKKKIQARIFIFMKKFFIEMKTNINPDIFYETDFILRKNQSLYFFFTDFFICDFIFQSTLENLPAIPHFWWKEGLMSFFGHIGPCYY